MRAAKSATPSNVLVRIRGRRKRKRGISHVTKRRKSARNGSVHAFLDGTPKDLLVAFVFCLALSYCL
jgi:hypothetical protein